MENSRKCRIGIMGPGRIAEKFVMTIAKNLVPDALVLAVSSESDPERARLFAEKWEIPRVYDTYQKLLSDRDIDLIYVATTNNMHYTCCMRAISAGKGVLCEKPLAMTEAEAVSIYQASRECGVFLMEAMWTRFTPAVIQAKRWVEEGRIGTLYAMSASFCVVRDPGEYPRLFDPKSGGGAFYDLGVYCFELLQYFAGNRKLLDSKYITGMSRNGVDLSGFLLNSYEGGLTGEIKFSIAFHACNEAYLCGDKGYIRLPADFHYGLRAELFAGANEVNSSGREEEPEEVFCHRGSYGFEEQIIHASRCVLDGRPESDIMPMADTIACARMFEKVLRGGKAEVCP